MRLVKRPFNQDERVRAYHLFTPTAKANPGTDLPFSILRHRRERRGTNRFPRRDARRRAEKSLGFWTRSFAAGGLVMSRRRRDRRIGFDRLTFETPKASA